MVHARHNTEVFRWVLHNAAPAVHGPPAATLIDRAVADRPNTTDRAHRHADPVPAERTWEFVEFMTPVIARAALAS